VTSTAAAIHLQYVIDNWSDLTDMLTTHHGAPWPPAGRMADQIAAMKAADATPEEITEASGYVRAARRLAERADSDPTALGESPVPIRLAILDTMHRVQADLLHCADVLATEVQRPVMPKAPSHWLPADREKRDKLAAADSADARRWNWRSTKTRTAVYAAAWLLARVDGPVAGPFLRLTTVQIRQVQGVAKAAAGRIEQALDLVQHVQPVDRPCPQCGGELVVASGDGELPVVTCFGCRQTWTLELPAVA
jgi:hypothetical protein